MRSDLTSSSRRALDPSSTCTVVQCTALELVQLGVVILLFSMTNPRPSCRVKRTLLVVVKSVCKGNTAGSYVLLLELCPELEVGTTCPTTTREHCTGCHRLTHSWRISAIDIALSEHSANVIPTLYLAALLTFTNRRKNCKYFPQLESWNTFVRSLDDVR